MSEKAIRGPRDPRTKSKKTEAKPKRAFGDRFWNWLICLILSTWIFFGITYNLGLLRARSFGFFPYFSFDFWSLVGLIFLIMIAVDALVGGAVYLFIWAIAKLKYRKTPRKYTELHEARTKSVLRKIIATILNAVIFVLGAATAIAYEIFGEYTIHSLIGGYIILKFIVWLMSILIVDKMM